MRVPGPTARRSMHGCHKTVRERGGTPGKPDAERSARPVWEGTAGRRQKPNEKTRPSAWTPDEKQACESVVEETC